MSSFSHSFTAGIPRLAQHRRWNTWNIISRYWQSRLGEGVWSEQSQKAGQVPISSTEQPPVHPPGPTWPGRMFPTSLAKNRNPCPQSVWCCCLCYRYSVAQPCLTLRSLGLQYSKPPCPSLGALHTCIFIYIFQLNLVTDPWLCLHDAHPWMPILGHCWSKIRLCLT